MDDSVWVPGGCFWIVRFPEADGAEERVRAGDPVEAAERAVERRNTRHVEFPDETVVEVRRESLEGPWERFQVDLEMVPMYRAHKG